LDPDTFTRPIAPAELHKAEAPEHYFDLELLGSRQIPTDRYGFIALCAEQKLDPSKVGLLPYAITECAGRLTVALAEHRKWPENRHIQMKCLVYAGALSHYAQDLCQPLHVTIHFDGRAGENTPSPRSGIHLKTDALLGKVKMDGKVTIKDAPACPFDKLFPAIIAELKHSNSLVDEVYRLEGDLPEAEAPIKPPGPAEEFAKERLRAAAGLTAWLYVTAWENSKDIVLPDWHRRGSADDEPMTQKAAPSTRPAATSTGPAAKKAD
jgi:hypothetical protein